MKQVNNPTSKTSDNQLRSVSRVKLGNLSRSFKSALKRKARLEAKLSEVRAIINRKYEVRKDANGNASHIHLTPAQIQGLALKRDEIDAELALAKRDCVMAEKEYRLAVKNNKAIQRTKTREIKEQNQIIRNQNALLKKTHKLIDEHGRNGGAAQVQTLKSLAIDGDVKAFRAAFDEVVGSFEPAHHTTISGVSQVKTEIVHSVMEELAGDAKAGEAPMMTNLEGGK